MAHTHEKNSKIILSIFERRLDRVREKLIFLKKKNPGGNGWSVMEWFKNFQIEPFFSLLWSNGEKPVIFELRKKTRLWELFYSFFPSKRLLLKNIHQYKVLKFFSQLKISVFTDGTILKAH